jgi:hypothetical protein
MVIAETAFEHILIDLIADMTLLAGITIILIYIMKKEDIRQKSTDERFEKLTSTFINSTIDYSSQLLTIIDNLPVRQQEMLKEVSNLHLDSVKMIIAELKVITTKIDESIRPKEQ